MLGPLLSRLKPRLGAVVSGESMVRNGFLTARRLCNAAPTKSLLEAGQVDAGFYQGSALLASAVVATQVIPEDTQVSFIREIIKGFRYLGLCPGCISDQVLVQDFLRKNALAAQNVLLASPTFYFLFSFITGQNLAVCCVRAITGTMRIVPFMGLFYGAFACLAPFATQWYMKSGNKSYEESVTGANIALMLGGARAHSSRTVPMPPHAAV